VTPTQLVVSRLKGVKRQSSGDWIARCPAHEDHTPSLSITAGTDGRALVKCHAGCTTEQIVDAVGLTLTDLFTPRASNGNGPTPYPVIVAMYDYTDANSALLYQVVRYEPKGFRQRRPDPARPGEWLWDVNGVKRVPLHLAEVLDAIAHERTLFVVEGEKVAEALRALGLIATTLSGGANVKWSDNAVGYFAGADVVVLPDNDEPGRAYAEAGATALSGIAARVRLLALPGLPPKGDAVEWIAAGGAADELLKLAEATPDWRPEAATTRRDYASLAELMANPDLREPPTVVIPGLAWKGRTTLLSGAPKSGKSTLTNDAGARVTRAEKFLGGTCAPGIVLVLSEEHAGDIVRRLVAFGADPEKIFILNLCAYGPERLDVVCRAIVVLRPDVVIGDTLTSLLSGIVKDANSSSEIAPHLARLSALCAELGTALVLNHHAIRTGGRYAGSFAIGAMVDAGLELEIPGTDPTSPERRITAVARFDVENIEYTYNRAHHRHDLNRNGAEGGVQPPLRDRIVAHVEAHPGTTIGPLKKGIRAKRT